MSAPVFYRPEQSVEGMNSYSPSAGKPKLFVERVDGFEIPFEPITIDDLLTVHDEAYVRGVFDGTRNNGFENNDPRVAQACLYTVGSLLAAARAAIECPEIPMCSPTSGFHHAGYSEGGGFCTFNGLMVVAHKLLTEDPSARVAILDCDVHYGDGTDDILRRKPDLAARVLHLTAGKQINSNESPIAFRRWLDEAIDQINAYKPTVVLYQAGADMHVDDPLGGILNDSQMMGRDLAVFERIAAPIAWNLAGGYQKPVAKVLDIHSGTFFRARGSATKRRKLLGDPNPEIWQAFERWALYHHMVPDSRGTYTTAAWSAWLNSWLQASSGRRRSR